jgi:hypothetical protein
MTHARDLAISHLKLRLHGIHRVLDAAVRAQIDHAARLVRADLTPICITEDEALHLLDDAERFVLDAGAAPWQLEDAVPDAEAEAELRAQAQDAGIALPLDVLAGRFDLSAVEQFAVLLCAAPDLDRGYERIYAFILDELNRRSACVELVSMLAAASFPDRIACRHALARFGKLRRCGILVARGDGGELRQELRLGDGLLGYLTGDGSDLACLCRDTVTAPEACAGAPDPRVARFAEGFSGGALRVAGVWGPPQSGKDEFVHALALALGARLRGWTPPADSTPALASLRDAAQETVVAGCLLWICADDFTQPAHRETARMLARELATASVRVVLTAAQPWRPAELLASGGYVEIELAALTLASRDDMWGEEMPELDAAEAHRNGDAPAARPPGRARRGTDGAQRRAARDHRPRYPVQARAARNLRARRQPVPRIRQPDPAKRGPDDLILPQAVHHQVLEIAQFFRAWPTVAETWGFGRLATGDGGIKALFTGESGTGKTLAAEVIAGELQMPLLRVELSRVVSKWVGETEKNLEAAFAEAEDGQAVLLFDEADALFGRRGQVESGVDRYANLEVSYLLQRLDDHGGLVLLASNLKDNIDSAFTRRFQTILHFPRPERPERLRIWQMAFPREAPVDTSIDFNALANLDMTGAGIVGAARTAALFAAEEKTGTIGKSHIVRAIARQFRREARLLTPVELGPYASLLQEAR